ncbi:unnamed protein product, partial [Adineta steineri]
STRQISVLDTIVGKSQALTSLQIRDINLILNGVTNIGITAMDVPLKLHEVHDLVNCAGRLITCYVRQFVPDDAQQTSSLSTTTGTDNELVNTSTRRTDSINRNINSRPLETQQNISTSSKRAIFETHITAHCQGLTFSTTLLSTLKVQYKIGVANIGGMKSRSTANIHEHTLHLLNNNNHDHQQPPTVSSDNYVRIDFPEIRCYGNYSIEQEQKYKTKDHLNLREKLDVLKLIITDDFLAQLLFVSKIIIHEINEILAKVSEFDRFHFGTTKHTSVSSSSIVPIIRIGSTDTENEDDDERGKDQPTIPSTLFTY